MNHPYINFEETETESAFQKDHHHYAKNEIEKFKLQFMFSWILQRTVSIESIH